MRLGLWSDTSCFILWNREGSDMNTDEFLRSLKVHDFLLEEYRCCHLWHKHSLEVFVILPPLMRLSGWQPEFANRLVMLSAENLQQLVTLLHTQALSKHNSLQVLFLFLCSLASCNSFVSFWAFKLHTKENFMNEWTWFTPGMVCGPLLTFTKSDFWHCRNIEFCSLTVYSAGNRYLGHPDICPQLRTDR